MCAICMQPVAVISALKVRYAQSGMVRVVFRTASANGVTRIGQMTLMCGVLLEFNRN